MLFRPVQPDGGEEGEIDAGLIDGINNIMINIIITRRVLATSCSSLPFTTLFSSILCYPIPALLIVSRILRTLAEFKWANYLAPKLAVIINNVLATSCYSLQLCSPGC